MSLSDERLSVVRLFGFVPCDPNSVSLLYMLYMLEVRTY